MSEKLFIRRGEAKAILGVSDEVFTGLVDAGTLKPVYMPHRRRSVKGRKCKAAETIKGRAYFKRAEVVKLAEGKNN